MKKIVHFQVPTNYHPSADDFQYIARILKDKLEKDYEVIFSPFEFQADEMVNITFTSDVNVKDILNQLENISRKGDSMDSEQYFIELTPILSHSCKKDDSTPQTHNFKLHEIWAYGDGNLLYIIGIDKERIYGRRVAKSVIECSNYFVEVDTKTTEFGIIFIDLDAYYNPTLDKFRATRVGKLGVKKIAEYNDKNIEYNKGRDFESL